MEVIFLAGAETDVLSACARYEEWLPGLGDRFEEALNAGVQRLAQFPEIAPVYGGLFRRLVIPKFPHGVFYAVHGQRVIVTAVLDLRQDPRTIARRLGL